MSSTRRTRTQVTYTTRRGRSISITRETYETPDHRTPPTHAALPYNHVQARVHIPPLASSQGPYSVQPLYVQPPVIPHRSAHLVTHSHVHSHTIHHPHPSAHLVEPQNQLRGVNRDSSSYASSRSSVSSSTKAKGIQSWINGTVQANTLSPNSRHTHSRHAGSASGVTDQQEDRSQRRSKERSRHGSAHTPSHHSGTDGRSNLNGRTATHVSRSETDGRSRTSGRTAKPASQPGTDNGSRAGGRSARDAS